MRVSSTSAAPSFRATSRNAITRKSWRTYPRGAARVHRVQRRLLVIQGAGEQQSVILVVGCEADGPRRGDHAAVARVLQHGAISRVGHDVDTEQAAVAAHRYEIKHGKIDVTRRGGNSVALCIAVDDLEIWHTGLARAQQPLLHGRCRLRRRALDGLDVDVLILQAGGKTL